ncbi:hypothetical protein AB0F17_08400 [Nonomuraea sp. NPDC026600]|uniref:hypothetical protein n=1 Tax=Nonomuraea sp. NPDC026600 TaxID=3155363 RepID=UPI0033ED500A
MPLLDATHRARTAAQWMRENTTTCTFTKASLHNAIGAADQWVEDNLASFNNALPAGFKAAATAEQKADLLGFLLWRRIGKLKAEED